MTTPVTGKETEPCRIDWKFIGDLEGGQRLVGYVPVANRSRSGVTIATGFDIGQRSRSDLEKLGLPQQLVTLLLPYCGRKGPQAETYLAGHHLTITPMQAHVIDVAVKRNALESLEKEYNRASSVPFRALPPKAQTVIASVSFQYGSLRVKTPNFWRCVTHQRWRDAVKELRNFGDAFETRRRKEAALLERAERIDFPLHGSANSSSWSEEQSLRSIGVPVGTK